jgi:hypothetical protein
VRRLVKRVVVSLSSCRIERSRDPSDRFTMARRRVRNISYAVIIAATNTHKEFERERGTTHPVIRLTTVDKLLVAELAYKHSLVFLGTTANLTPVCDLLDANTVDQPAPRRRSRRMNGWYCTASCRDENGAC